jgi:hypothetical protein
VTLRLDYGFTPSPSPLQCSQEHGIDSVVALGVTVAPANGAVDLQEVQIAIPTGSLAGLTLAPLPQPEPDPSATGWTIGTDGGGSILITPAAAVSRTLDSQLAFTIPHIVVSSEVNDVYLTITETYADDTAETDSTTYKLSKQAFAFALDYFKAKPADLTSLYESVKLYWHVIADDTVGYRLSSPGWTPTKTYDPEDGRKGVPTDKLTETTQFTLDVVSAQSGVLGSATCWVTLTLPTVLPGAKLEPWLGATGCLLAGSWKTRNANGVSIEINKQTVDDAAPADTWLAPYPVVVAATTNDLSISAYGAKGTSPDPYPLGGVTVETPAKPPAVWAVGMVITLDGKYAAVMGAGAMTSVELATGTVDQRDLSFIKQNNGGDIVAVSAATDGQDEVVVAFTSHGWLLELFEGGWGAGYAWPQLHRPVHGGSVASDASVAVVLSDVVVLASLDPDAHPTALPEVSSPVACAVTRDNTLALVTIPSGEVAVVHLPDGAVEQTRIAAGTSGGAIAVSAEHAFALVADPTGTALAVIDIPSRKRIGDPIALPDKPGQIAISQDGKLGIVALPGKSAICVVDIGRRRASPALIPVGGPPSAVAVTADGGKILVSVEDSLLLL